MKKGLALCMTAVLAMGCLLTGCGSSDTGAKSTTGSAAAGTEAAETETAGTEAAGTQTTDGEKKTFTVGFDASFPPYGYQENGEYVGFDLDLAQEVCDRNGWELVKTPIDWDAKNIELNGGSIDCIWNGFTIREDLKESIDFSNAYCKNMQVAVIKAENSGKYTDLASLAKANIVAEAGSSGESAVADCEELKECNYVGVSKMADALLEVKAGTADAAVVDYVMAKAMVGEGTDYSDLQIVDGIELAYEEYGIGFRKGSNLVESVNKAMDEMIADGSLKAIADKYGLALMAD